MGSEQDLAAAGSHRDLLPPIPRWATLPGWRAAHEPPFGAARTASMLIGSGAPIGSLCALRLTGSAWCRWAAASPITAWTRSP